MTRLILALFIVLGAAQTLTAQKKITYHVTAKSLSLKSEANDNAENLKQLKQYDNLTLQESIDDKEWVKVKFKSQEGYVAAKAIASGEAVVTYSSVRTGAVCRDGSSSKATGRGACSHHGGVSRWKTKRKQSVTIIENEKQ
ncbi:MAG: hypothetical protein Roseis2KO_43780 [Roseivirga sp.]